MYLDLSSTTQTSAFSTMKVETAYMEKLEAPQPFC